jgi:SAM-dependent methyltransferase
MLAVMSDEVSFASDLYRGTAGYYDRFRLLYPRTLIGDLACRTSPSGRGRLLDLACGTGQLAFALRAWFAEVWAVDQEPDMVEVVAAKAAVLGGLGALGGERIRAVVSSAEDLDVPAGYFELIVIGNAFHRLRRDLVARLACDWLAPGGFLALCWSSGTQAGPLDWQRAFGSLLRRWAATSGSGERVPANWDRARKERPDAEVLSAAGFELAGRFEFSVEHRWTLPELAGFARSLSVLPASVLAEHTDAFDADLFAVLGPHASDGVLTETVSFAYELGCRSFPWPLFVVLGGAGGVGAAGGRGPGHDTWFGLLEFPAWCVLGVVVLLMTRARSRSISPVAIPARVDGSRVTMFCAMSMRMAAL